MSVNILIAFLAYCAACEFSPKKCQPVTCRYKTTIQTVTVNNIKKKEMGYYNILFAVSYENEGTIEKDSIKLGFNKNQHPSVFCLKNPFVGQIVGIDECVEYRLK